MSKSTPSKYLLAIMAILLISANNYNETSLNALKISDNAENEYLLSIESQGLNKSGQILTVSPGGVIHIGSSLNRTETLDDGYSLYAEKGIRTERVKVDIANKAGWADYVFTSDYQLLSIEELESYIIENNHLPGVPNTEEVLKNGLDLAESNKILLEKVEELSLHIISLNERLKTLESK